MGVRFFRPPTVRIPVPCPTTVELIEIAFTDSTCASYLGPCAVMLIWIARAHRTDTGVYFATPAHSRPRHNHRSRDERLATPLRKPRWRSLPQHKLPLRYSELLRVDAAGRMHAI